MPRFIFFLLFCLCALPISGLCSDDVPPKTHLIAKDKLQCLYAQTESLLKESHDPLIVILNNQCGQPPKKLARGEKGDVLVPNPIVGSNATLKPEDVLLLSHAELQCFKQEFTELIKQIKDPVKISFSDTCTKEGSDKP